MDLHQLLKILNKNRYFLTTISVVCALTTGVFSLIKGNEYELAAYLDLGSDGYQDTDDYKYDNYYRFENAKRLILSTEQWMKDEALINEIFERAKINKDKVKISTNPKATQISDTTLKISWQAKEQKNLKEIEPYLDEVLQERLNIVNNDTDIIYTITTTGSTIKKNSFSPWIMGLIGLGIGLWLGILWVVMREYLKTEKKK